MVFFGGNIGSFLGGKNIKKNIKKFTHGVSVEIRLRGPQGTATSEI